MSDKALIERLRDAAAALPGSRIAGRDGNVCDEAADTIARLTAELQSAQGMCDAYADENQRISDERDAAREHAAMYLWLRERYPTLTTMQAARGLGLDLSRVYVDSAEKFDDAIRAAMREGEGR